MKMNTLSMQAMKRRLLLFRAKSQSDVQTVSTHLLIEGIAKAFEFAVVVFRYTVRYVRPSSLLHRAWESALKSPATTRASQKLGTMPNMIHQSLRPCV